MVTLDLSRYRKVFLEIKEGPSGGLVAHVHLANAKTAPAAATVANGQLPFRRTRMPKEEIRRLALEAARSLIKQGKRITMAAVARTSGLQYYQIIYAFGNRAGLLEALSR